MARMRFALLCSFPVLPRSLLRCSGRARMSACSWDAPPVLRFRFECRQAPQAILSDPHDDLPGGSAGEADKERRKWQTPG